MNGPFPVQFQDEIWWLKFDRDVWCEFKSNSQWHFGYADYHPGHPKFRFGVKDSNIIFSEINCSTQDFRFYIVHGHNSTPLMFTSWEKIWSTKQVWRVAVMAISRQIANSISLWVMAAVGTQSIHVHENPRLWPWQTPVLQCLGRTPGALGLPMTYTLSDIYSKMKIFV